MKYWAWYLEEAAKLRGITLEQAKKSLQTVRTSSGEYEIEPLSGLTRPDAIRFQNALEAGGVMCRILPPLMEQ